MSDNKIIRLFGKPVELEILYRDYPDQFESWLNDALLVYPDSETLNVWNARINYHTPKSQTSNNVELLFVIALSLVSGFLVKLPVFFSIPGNWFYPRFIPLIILSSLVAYFLCDSATQNRKKKQLFLLVCFFVLLLCYLFQISKILRQL